MSKQKNLSTLPPDLRLEVAERIAQHFKEGIFEFDLDSEGHMLWREIPSIMLSRTLQRTVQRVSSTNYAVLCQEIWRKGATYEPAARQNHSIIV